MFSGECTHYFNSKFWKCRPIHSRPPVESLIPFGSLPEPLSHGRKFSKGPLLNNNYRMVVVFQSVPHVEIVFVLSMILCQNLPIIATFVFVWGPYTTKYTASESFYQGRARTKSSCEGILPSDKRNKVVYFRVWEFETLSIGLISIVDIGITKDS